MPRGVRATGRPAAASFFQYPLCRIDSCHVNGDIQCSGAVDGFQYPLCRIDSCHARCNDKPADRCASLSVSALSDRFMPRPVIRSTVQLRRHLSVSALSDRFMPPVARFCRGTNNLLSVSALSDRFMPLLSGLAARVNSGLSVSALSDRFMPHAFGATATLDHAFSIRSVGSIHATIIEQAVPVRP